MNYYIDFDHTLFDTENFVNKSSKCSDLIFVDSLRFIKKLKQMGHKIYILSYSKQELDYQILKIANSNISNLFDGIIISKELKFNLDIDYKNGIFIDDNPRDLMGLYSRNPKRLIRLKRKNQKYSLENLNINIEEYENFDEIPLDLEG